jgi:hypothetical protein
MASLSWHQIETLTVSLAKMSGADDTLELENNSDD